MNRITHIRMSAGGTSVEHIIDVKGTNSNGTFEYTVPQVVNYLKQGFQFHVVRFGYNIEVKWERNPHTGREFIKTYPDSTKVDNLLSLPRF
ncbi:MAG: DUF3892 domain-containing protein [Bacteroidetes bacterium]|nr:DUF3892 domain-containing protein [Bacteroidota bacterium]